MFTGLVEEKGKIAAINDDSGGSKTLSVISQIVHHDAILGASIAINGCCLTVVKIDGAILSFQAGEETLKRTSLGSRSAGDAVNLERALKVGDRLGGHYVSGHIDGLAKLDRRIDDEDWSYFWFELEPRLTKQMASKGSVTIDGVSLTLVDVEPSRFSVALIPHTLEVTTLGTLEIGDFVNVETDILAKYVEQQLLRNRD